MVKKNYSSKTLLLSIHGQHAKRVQDRKVIKKLFSTQSDLKLKERYPTRHITHSPLTLLPGSWSLNSVILKLMELPIPLTFTRLETLRTLNQISTA